MIEEFVFVLHPDADLEALSKLHMAEFDEVVSKRFRGGFLYDESIYRKWWPRAF